ncbi:MAG TPA: class I SAM-dependent methyltransferase [Solirubrobacteraceae bacterium]|nr:class I SAM-dependent methyltransferase [Solirubrobacteraceae bacterium]
MSIPDPQAARERNRAIWEAGDWDLVAPRIEPAGPRLLDRLGEIGAGVRLLDVGTGSGNAIAIPAALRGADVVGSDITDAWFDAARRRAAEAGAEVRWVVGDAVELPFDDGEFDVVTSTFGHMFAPDHDAAARELVRVCRPGGRIGLCCWTPESHFSRMLMIVAGHLPPPPPGVRPPALWGSESHVGGLLEPLGVTLQMRREVLSIRAPSSDLQLAFFENAFGPFVTAKAALGDGWPAVRQDVIDFVSSVNEADDGTLTIEFEYLETIGRRAD